MRVESLDPGQVLTPRPSGRSEVMTLAAADPVDQRACRGHALSRSLHHHVLVPRSSRIPAVSLHNVMKDRTKKRVRSFITLWS